MKRSLDPQRSTPIETSFSASNKTLIPKRADPGKRRKGEKKMKHRGWLFLTVLSMATSLFAQDSNQNQQKEMTGTICNSACVVRQSNLPTCDTTCTDKSGDCVLVGDKGNVEKIANPQMAMPHMNKRVKVMVVPSEKERENVIRIMHLTESAG
jgi:hypothetical protein